jgi:hypothetical protein
MKKIIPAALSLALFALLVSASWADSNINPSQRGSEGTVAQFTKVIDDLPLMPGLTPVEEKDVLFTSPTGRIAQTTATGSVDVDSVYQFYKSSLPHLGWKIVDARTYERDNERLRIDVSGVNPKATTVVRFSVQPVAKAQ